jgi:hypothetical protein
VGGTLLAIVGADTREIDYDRREGMTKDEASNVRCLWSRIIMPLAFLFIVDQCREWSGDPTASGPDEHECATTIGPHSILWDSEIVWYYHKLSNFRKFSNRFTSSNVMIFS